MIRKSGGLAYPLFRLQTRLFDYWSPLCHLRLKELCTLLWRGANRHIGHCRKLRLHVGLREARDDDVVKPRNNVFGRAGGCYEGSPCYALDLRDPASAMVRISGSAGDRSFPVTASARS